MSKNILILKVPPNTLATESTLQSVLAAVGGGSFSTRFDDAGSNISYIGKATVGSSTSSGVWQIQKLDETGGDASITFADGNANFDNVWDDRASLTYS